MAPPVLDEDTIDDLLYFARIADVAELQSIISQVSQKLEATPHDVLAAAKDADTGNTTMHMAAANGHSEVIKLLLSMQPSPTASGPSQAPSLLINAPNNVGNTPLHWATLNGHLEAVKVLVDAGADLLAKNNAGHDVAYEAELAGKEEVVNWLLSAQKDDETLGKEEETDVTEADDPPAEGDKESTG